MDNKRIPSLDGWRCVSILVVMLGHQIEHAISAKTINSNFRYFDFAYYGVQIFFVISGFLITNLLVQEKKATGKVSLKKFYIRRAFRILPAFFTFLIVVFFLNEINHGPITSIEWFKAIFFLMNINYAGGTLGHIWSLSAEEQYYLLWPYLYSSNRLKNIVPIIFILVCPVLSILNQVHIIHITRFSLLMNIDAIFIGALFAIHRNNIFVLKLKEKANYIILFTLVLLVFSTLSLKYTGMLTIPFLHTFFSLSVILLINKSFSSNTLSYKLFNTKPFEFIGQISYSLYLWQQIFIFPSSLTPIILTVFPLNWLVIFIFAYLSRILIELPFLNLRKRAILVKSTA